MRSQQVLSLCLPGCPPPPPRSLSEQPFSCMYVYLPDGGCVCDPRSKRGGGGRGRAEAQGLAEAWSRLVLVEEKQRKVVNQDD